MENSRYFVAALIGILLYGCSSTAFAPFDSPNPWKDDYSPYAAMEHYASWGTYNVHDPSCRKLGEYYYMYSTDAIFREDRKEAEKKGVPLGYIQVRRSKDLVHWEFCGWAFPDIPRDAVEWVRDRSGGQGATNIWAPYIIPYKNKYRLYYCVSAFGRKTSYIGLAESTSPEGPWEQIGCVVKTDDSSPMNAIDPSVIVDDETGKWWMHYGSFLEDCIVELDPNTGLSLTPEDKGHLVARRANYRKDNLEAPEIFYHRQLKKYFLFVSYDPLMTTYNVRAGRSDEAVGPFYDFFGEQMKDTTDNFPVLTAPYRFRNHPGWAGTGHCSVFTSDEGGVFMAHQGRLSPHNLLMDLHVRQVFFTDDGWPVVSPERYAGTKQRRFSSKDVEGEWEVIRIRESRHQRKLEAGQILWGEGELNKKEWNLSELLFLEGNGVLGNAKGSWNFQKREQRLTLTIEGEEVRNLILFAGHDWENERETILFTGLDSSGRSVWGKRIK